MLISTNIVFFGLGAIHIPRGHIRERGGLPITTLYNVFNYLYGYVLFSIICTDTFYHAGAMSVGVKIVLLLTTWYVDDPFPLNQKTFYYPFPSHR